MKMQRLWFLAGMVALSGCNLALDLNEYPYQQQPLIIPDEDMAADMTSPPDMPVDMTPPPPDMPVDMGPQKSPRLLFTELMVDTTSMGVSAEYGEYIEVFNAGEGPAVLSRVSIKLDTTTNNTIRPYLPNGPSAIPPFSYFVFLRKDAPAYGIIAEIGTDAYAQWSDTNLGIALSNSGRKIELVYDDPIRQEAIVHDTLEWGGSKLPVSTADTPGWSIRENRAISLKPDAYHMSADRTDPSRWCYDHTSRFGELGLFGSPGTDANLTACHDTPDPPEPDMGTPDMM